MANESSYTPTVLVGYPGPEPAEDLQDIFVYVRPETNNVQIESRLLKVVRNCPAYRNGLELIYMANLPGQYMIDNQIIERHYAHKLFFAVHGARSFTAAMRREFEYRTGETFFSERILGGFEALSVLDITPEGLFALWVDQSEVVSVAGQTVKRIDDYWVIGYDIPALMHKNTRNTDIAVMLFRSTVGYPYFADLVDDMYGKIMADGLLDSRLPRGRVFHYSRSPFEQILDGMGYLIRSDGTQPGLGELSYSQYLYSRGVSERVLQGVLDNPVFLWGRNEDEKTAEAFVEKGDGRHGASTATGISSGAGVRDADLAPFELDIYNRSEHMTNSEAFKCLTRPLAQRMLHLERPVGEARPS